MSRVKLQPEPDQIAAPLRLAGQAVPATRHELTDIGCINLANYRLAGDLPT